MGGIRKRTGFCNINIKVIQFIIKNLVIIKYINGREKKITSKQKIITATTIPVPNAAYEE